MAEAAPISNNFNNDNEAFLVPTNAPPESSRLPVYVRILRKIALVLSAVTLVVLTALMIILSTIPFRSIWDTEQYTLASIQLMVLILIFSIINVVVAVPALLNSIAEFSFTWAIISCLIGFMDAFPHYEWCYIYRDPVPVHPKCVEWRLVVTILMGVASGFAIILGAILVVLLLLHIHKIIKSKFWNTASMSLPMGEITWTMSLKFSRNDGESSSGLIQEARSAPTGQGPVHL